MSPENCRYQTTTLLPYSTTTMSPSITPLRTEYYKIMYAAPAYYTKAPNPLLVVY
ncbi:hypothetical protein DAPPUDRAFT_232895 [Daphnia pulex]|uniref:Uncharacterized protein n=1 Tax=Daphnia pulex TaxID=6669 RepID=E9FSM8_DAPPU|nr:hypothetical protein DAPPUDRAFT_232895 [Daphnia pulex]|eukprot:EFX89799.1 hypothetical protein DAPPUDRAFT_232895 [Daphnia pulex]